MKFGAHMSIAGGVQRAIALGEQAGCDTIQIFTANQQQWTPKPLPEADVAMFKAECARSGLGPLVVHDSYLINLASQQEALWEKSIAAFRAELTRCALLEIPYLVTHPGAHTGAGIEAGLERVSLALDRLFAAGAGGPTTVLLETTAGQGTYLGSTFEQIAYLIRQSKFPERLGVCVDSCHIFAAGYDIRTPETYAATFAAFDQAIGIERIKCFHLNDSQKAFGSHADRHAQIGEGDIGLEGFRLLVNDPRFTQLPAILETPKGDDLAEDIANLATLRGLITA